MSTSTRFCKHKTGCPVRTTTKCNPQSAQRMYQGQLKSNTECEDTNIYSPPALECCTAISLSCLIYLFCNAGLIQKRRLKKKKKRLSTARHDHILCSSFPFFKTTPCTATLANQQGLRSARTGLYIHKIKSSLSVTLFIFNHVPSMTPALCAGSIWTHWKEFPDLPRATAQLMASCCPPQKSKLLPCCLHLPSFKIKGGKKSVFYLKQTNKNQIKWNQRLFVFCCKHGLPWWQDLA